MEDDLEQAIREWREAWSAKMRRHSWHPVIFWEAVAERLIVDRRAVELDPRICAGSMDGVGSPAFKMLTARHQKALALEMAKDINSALILYEAGVADCFSSHSPYDRLRDLYTQRGWYEDALRVCAAYVAQPERPGMRNHEYFRRHAAQLLSFA
ncbi:hypothetical protein PLCT2_02306 [Planctomycetaceae bacterium]|nr:hypothetical protein PLCT2_02306 [Planctomycetaceae bacterium]